MFDEMNGNQSDLVKDENNPYLATQQRKITPIQDEPKKKTAIVVVLVILAVVLVIAIVVLAVLGVFGNKKTKLAKAMTTTFIESGDYLKEAWKIDQYEGMFENKECSLEVDLSLPEGMGFEMAYNADEEKSGLYMDIGMSGSSLVELECYFDDSRILAAVPNMLDYVFVLDLDNIEEDVQVAVQNGMLDEYTAEELIEALNAKDTDEISEEAAKELTDSLTAAWEKFYDGVEVEEIEAQELTVNGEKKKCKGYAVLANSEQIADLMEDVLSAFECNEEVKEVLVSAVTANGMDYEEEMDTLRDEIDVVRDSEKEIEVDFYLHAGKVAQVYCEDDEDDFSFAWDIQGGNFPLENTSIKAGSDFDGYMEIVRTGSMEDGEYTAEYEIIDTAYESSYVMETCYNSESGEISIDLSGNEENSVSMAGSIRKVSDSTIEVAIDTFEVDEEEILSGDITIINKCGEIVQPEGKEMNILTMTNDEWNMVGTELLESMY